MVVTATWVRGAWRPIVSTLNQVKRHWYAVALTTACVLFTASYWVDQRGVATLQRHFQDIADGGGGLIVVSATLECVQTSAMMREAAQRIQDNGIPVHGLVVADGGSPRLLHRALTSASERFPHEVVRWRTVRPLVELTGMPVVVGVDAASRILFVERVETFLMDDRYASIHRLLAQG